MATLSKIWFYDIFLSHDVPESIDINVTFTLINTHACIIMLPSGDTVHEHSLNNCRLYTVICEIWHFPNMYKAIAWQHHFTKRGGLGP